MSGTAVAVSSLWSRILGHRQAKFDVKQRDVSLIMIIQFFLKADSEKVDFGVPQTDLHQEMKNVMAYKTANRAIFAVGYDADDLHEESPEAWEKVKPEASFVRPFDVKQFEPYFAAAYLDFGTTFVRDKIRSHSLHFWITYFIDRFDCELKIKGYETLSYEKQQEFVYFLQTSRSKRFRRLLINGQDTRQTYQRQLLVIWFMKWIGILWMLILFVGAWIGIGQFTELFQKSSTEASIAAIIASIVLAIGLSYVGFFLGALSTLLVLRYFLPRSLLKTVLSNYRLGLGRPVENWLTNVASSKDRVIRDF